MFVLLLTTAYISFVSFSWGVLFLRTLQKINGSNDALSYGFSITCFIGLACIGAVAQVISLFTGLGSLPLQAAFLLPAVFSGVFLYKPGNIRASAKSFVQTLHPSSVLLLCSSVAMVLVMAVYPVTHPDTIAYHFQVIRWIEKYPAVPGLANFNYLYGFQNSWFIICGLFSFSFAGTNAITFANTAVLLWLLVFLVNKINTALKKPGQTVQALPWILLLVFQAWSYTQIRLTATSASPDFIAVLYVLLTVYLFFDSSSNASINDPLVFFLCFFAITLKLSVLPLLLLAAYLAIPLTRKKNALLLLLCCFVMLPYVMRNIITSGHLFFPAAFPDIIDADWKLSTNKLDAINRYILAFARTRDNVTEPAKLLAEPFSSWIQHWWAKLYLSDQIIIAVYILSLILLPFRYKTLVRQRPLNRILIAVSVTGVLFWVLKAPDPRFGLGFLVLLPALLLVELCSHEKAVRLATPKLVLFACFLAGCSIAFYTGYRCRNYFRWTNAVYPAGFTIPYQSFYYREINSSLPLIKESNKNITVSAAADSAYRPFNFRGKTVTAGFTEKK